MLRASAIRWPIQSGTALGVARRSFRHATRMEESMSHRRTFCSLVAAASAASAAAMFRHRSVRAVGCEAGGKRFRLGLCQTNVEVEKAESLDNVRRAVMSAVDQGAELVVLGEMFSCPYATKYFRQYGEEVPAVGDQVSATTGDAARCLAELAVKHGVWLVGGSLPELEDGHVYNTCLVFDPHGRVVARHRKAHLFDIDVPALGSRPAMKFRESEVLSAGNQLTLVDLPWCRAGVGICYDVRFPEMALALRKQGADLLIYPGAFNMTTGPAHWSILACGRAVDTQSFVVLASPARSPNVKDYQAWGHSMLVTPWGEVVVEADHTVGVWVADIDPEQCSRIREQVPTSNQKRDALYVPYATA